MHRFIQDLLECPQCHGALRWTITTRRGERIEEAEARCLRCGATYPVREGIGLFLTPDVPRDDLWEQAESGLMRHLHAHPDVERRLMDVPLDALAPADQFFRALALEERGDFAQARHAAEVAHSRLYTPAYRACYTSQQRFIVQRLAGESGPVVDLASGRGALVEALARELSVPIIASDFSPRILRRDRRWLEFFGLYDRVSLLAFDARRTPFADGAVATLTTNLGLPNMDQPELVASELRRIVSGTLLAISYFFPKDDAANAAAIRAGGRLTMLSRASALASLVAAGFQAELANRCLGRALPTPRGVVIEDAGIDGLPVAETTLEWGTLVAR